jgi:hypothetical protein
MADERAKRAAERVVDAIGDDRKFSGDAAVVDDIVSSEYADVLAENAILNTTIDGANAAALEADSHIASLEQQVAALQKWKQAIIDASVVGWVYTAEHETDPKKAINDLLCLERKMALDPAISPEVAALREDAERYRGVLEMLGSGASASLSAPDDMDPRDFKPHRDHQMIADWVMSATMLCLEDGMGADQIYEHNRDAAAAAKGE